MVALFLYRLPSRLTLPLPLFEPGREQRVSLYGGSEHSNGTRTLGFFVPFTLPMIALVLRGKRRLEENLIAR
jgi:hypothetical protein